ncbi:branched-chain amino acid aminotransferase/4-amino-4-deoxychorismate lyase [Geothermobacter ehrlichii]|uniref:branched-chain-amino-acid transaminase n=1 Tax=Geothermobacter ehrlichii TaxID=213224 RepID=A0A5D3WKM8_9BACT|nr:aminotransferase class IV [Geothermobacter ehrlichii]TYO98670.1 branched-chain amino acid aminotransferase/4-amino-4-deoxychorismate lyase [Geothermobacter ehrlichii]
MLSVCLGRLSEGAPQVDADQAALLYGDSLFETIRARGRELFWLDDHLDRIESGCRQSGIPFDRRQAEDDLARLASALPWPDARVRLTAGSGPLGSDLQPQGGLQFASAVPYTPPTPVDIRRGVACVFAPNRRVNSVSDLPQMKRGNYADCLYARRHAIANGAFEAVFVEPDGELLEGSISNIFLLLDGVLLTPPAGTLVLPGIARARVLQAARQLGLPTLEQPLYRDLLPQAREVFLTNSMFGLLPVTKIDALKLPAGPVARKIRQALGPPFADTQA